MLGLIIFAWILIFSSAAHSQFVWKLDASGTKANLKQVLYANNQFVIVGDSGIILTSTNGSTWNRRTTGTTKCLQSIANGGGHYVAVGDSGTILTSNDATSWTRQTITPYNLTMVVYGLNEFWATGGAAAQFSSVQGTVWTDATSAGFPATMVCLAFGNGQFVGVGYSKAYRSSNFTDWIQIDNLVGCALSYVTFRDSLFMIGEDCMMDPFGNVSYSINCDISTDGILWSSGIALASLPHDLPLFSCTNLFGVYGLYVMAGVRGVIWVYDSKHNDTIQTNSSADLYSIVYGNKTFVAVGDSGTIISSPLDSSFSKVKPVQRADVAVRSAVSALGNRLMVFLASDHRTNSVLVQVFTPAGRMVLSTQMRMQDRCVSIPIDHLSPGLYYATATCGGSVSKGSFVKSK
jgi:hypothetical protein